MSITPIEEVVPIEMRVSGKSNVKALTAALDISLDKGCAVVLRVIGAAAMNQAMKAIATSRYTHEQDEGNDICVRPSWVTLKLNGDVDISAIDLLVAIG